MSQWFNNILIALRFVEPEAEPTPAPTPEVTTTPAPAPKPRKPRTEPLWTESYDDDGETRWKRKPITVDDREIKITISKGSEGFTVTDGNTIISGFLTHLKTLSESKKLAQKHIEKYQIISKLTKDHSSLSLKWNITEAHNYKSLSGKDGVATTEFGEYKIFHGYGHSCRFFNKMSADPHPLSEYTFQLTGEEVGESGNDFYYCMYLAEEHHKKLQASNIPAYKSPKQKVLTHTTTVMIPKKGGDPDPRIVFEDEKLFPAHKQITLKKSEIERIRIPNVHDIKDLEEYSERIFMVFEKQYTDYITKNEMIKEHKIDYKNEMQKRFNAYLDQWRIIDISAKGVKLDFIVVSLKSKTLQELSNYIWNKPNFKKI